MDTIFLPQLISILFSFNLAIFWKMTYIFYKEVNKLNNEFNATTAWYATATKCIYSVRKLMKQIMNLMENIHAPTGQKCILL